MTATTSRFEAFLMRPWLVPVACTAFAMGFHCDGVASLSRSGQNAELLDPAAFVLCIHKTNAVTWRPEKFTRDHRDPLSSLCVFTATASRSRGLYCVVLGVLQLFWTQYGRTANAVLVWQGYKVRIKTDFYIFIFIFIVWFRCPKAVGNPWQSIIVSDLNIFFRKTFFKHINSLILKIREHRLSIWWMIYIIPRLIFHPFTKLRHTFFIVYSFIDIFSF